MSEDLFVCFVKPNDKAEKQEKDEKSEEELEEESEENPFVCQCGGCIESEKEEESEDESEDESEKQTETIWRAACDFDDAEDVYFKNKEDGKKYILDRMKVMLDNEQSYDSYGDLCFPYEFALQQVQLH